MKKIIYVILDGAAGRPCKTLNGMTSYEAAKTPTIDQLFNNSVNGLMHVVGPKIAPQSDVAAFATMGYSPFNVPSRGVIEAIGTGLKYKDGEVAMRCNIASVRDRKLMKVRLANMSRKQGLEIERLVNDGISLDVPFTFKHTVDYRGVLIIHKELPANVTNTHPGYIRERLGTELVSYARNFEKGVGIKPCRPLDQDSVETANIINDFTEQAQEVLTNAKIKDSRGVIANYIFSRDAGSDLPYLEPFKDLYGLKMALVAEMPAELGVAKLLGIDVLEPEELTKMTDKIIKALEKYDVVYFHIKGPDHYGHLGDAKGKVKEIERIDKEFFKPLLTKIDLNKFTICVSSDHATPACFGSHSSDPVPYLITNGGKVDGHFCEKNVKNTFIEGKELMSLIIEIARQ